MRIRSPLLIKILSRLAIWGVRLICLTCRKRTVGFGPASLYDDPDDCYLYSAWHDAILLSLLARRPARNMAALVSQHRDGGYVTELLEVLKIIPVRGSTSRGGVRALREMIRVSRENHVAITSDGPRGPRRQVSPGLVYLAAKTGRRIVPAAFVCTRSWSIQGSWTDMQIPKPFSTIWLVGNEAIAVPRKIDREGIEHYTAVLQRAMDETTARAESYRLGRDPALDERRLDTVERRAA